MRELRNIRIADGRLMLGGEEIFGGDVGEFRVFAKKLYRELGIDYAKFYKMSPLSKLGFLAAEYLLQGMDGGGIASEKVALVLANSSSSLHTDNIYQESVAHKPSPAIFVYTLPNIVIGEICIRHGYKGEGVFYIQEQFDRDVLWDHASLLLEEGEATWVLSGWVEMDIEGNYLADISLLAQ